MIKEVNFCIVNACSADCVFCPRKDYVSKPAVMSLSLLKKILDEMDSPEFIMKYGKVPSNIGENGEASLHPNLLSVLREFKKRERPINLFTNFSHLTEKVLQPIVEEQLISTIHLNVDGSEAETYKLMKNLDYAVFEKNMTDFIRIRGKGTSPALNIHVITAERYSAAVKKFFGQAPTFIPEGAKIIHNEEQKIFDKWNPLLHKSDWIGVEHHLMWGERNYTHKKQGAWKCSNISRVENVAYINPKGDWYACCFDMGNELVLGNVNEKTLMEIAEGEIRKELIRKLKENRFEEIGPPCNRVDACQVIP